MTNVMVVDDEADIRFMVRLGLEISGHSVVSAASAEEALDLLGSHEPDVMVLDLRLPGMDGMELLDLLRDQGRLGRMRVVVLSAHASAHMADEAAARGCDAYLTKPLSPERLRDVIEEVLAR